MKFTKSFWLQLTCLLSVIAAVTMAYMGVWQEAHRWEWAVSSVIAVITAWFTGLAASIESD